jgi:hypothetical protein
MRGRKKKQHYTNEDDDNWRLGLKRDQTMAQEEFWNN